MLKILMWFLLLTSSVTSACVTDTLIPVRRLREFVAQNVVHWDSKIEIAGLPLQSAPADESRQRQVLTDLMAKESPSFTQFRQELETFDDTNLLQRPRLWELYFRAYDLAVFSEHYAGLMHRIIGEIQPGDEVLDLGGGTGNLPALALAMVPQTKFTSIDISARGLAISEEKRRWMRHAKGRWKMIEGNILDGAIYPKQKYRVIVLNNVLYTLPEIDKRALFRSVRDHLAPGGIVIIGDPRPESRTPENLSSFIFGNWKSMRDRGCPLNDYALVTLLGTNRLLVSTHPLSSFEDIRGYAAEVSLNRRHHELQYLDGATFSVFEWQTAP